MRASKSKDNLNSSENLESSLIEGDENLESDEVNQPKSVKKSIKKSVEERKLEILRQCSEMLSLPPQSKKEDKMVSPFAQYVDEK